VESTSSSTLWFLAGFGLKQRSFAYACWRYATWHNGLFAVTCEEQSSRNLRELTFHIRDHHVLDFELRHGVRRVDVPGVVEVCTGASVLAMVAPYLFHRSMSYRYRYI